jgi:outer membrane protein assembly factor BamB
MSKSKNKTAITISLILMLTMIVSALSSTLPFVSAQYQTTGRTVKTGAFLSVQPNPVGVGQKVQVTFWAEPQHPLPDDVFHGYRVTITDPNGHVDDRGPFTSLGRQSIQFFTYKPSIIGEYTFHFTYDGETFSSTNDTYLPATAEDVILTVQEEPIPDYALTPLPTEYWTRPIDAQNTNWAPISGNWLFRGGHNGNQVGYGDSWGGHNPYTTAPLTAHIMWTQQMNGGGLAGGDNTGSIYSGATYNPYLEPPVIIGGLAFYYTHMSGAVASNSRLPGMQCVDLRTGEVQWTNPDALFEFGQVWQYTQVPNQAGQGSRAYLWGNTLSDQWKVYDVYTGELVFGYANAISTDQWAWWPDEFMSGSDGTIYGYILDGLNGWLAEWNSTKAYVDSGVRENVANPKLDYDWLSGIQYNTTIPVHIVSGSPVVYGGSVNPGDWDIGAVRQGIDSNVLLAKTSDWVDVTYYEMGYDISTGEELWVHGQDESVGTFFTFVGDGIYASWDIAAGTWVGYDIKTGKKLWTSDASTGWGGFVQYGNVIADGALFAGSYDGYLTAIDVTNGDTIWKFYAGNAGTATPYGSWPFWGGVMVGGGVVFSAGGQESPSNPLYPGYRLFAVNETTGQGIWNISGYFSVRAIADGYLMAFNSYDGRIYTFGRGPSKLTISAPSVGVTTNTPVTFTGSVTDIAAGTQQDRVASNYPSGVPCVSDSSQSQFMEAVYMQQPMPSDVTGVPVTLSVLDSNGNQYDIGTTTSDASGTYGLTWTPPIPGEFTVYATFEGTESYYGSCAATHLYASEAAAATAEPTPMPASTADLYFLPMSIGIIIAIIVVGLLLFLLLRKR